MIAPHQTNIFFSVKTRNKLIWSLHPRAISTSIENNSRVTLIELKNTSKTHNVPNRKKVTVIQPEDLNELQKQLSESVL